MRRLLLALLFLASRAEAQNPVSYLQLPPHASDPYTCDSTRYGSLYYKTGTDRIYECRTTGWTAIGGGGVPGYPLSAADGSYTAPSYSFSSDSNAGMLYDPAVTASNPGIVLQSPLTGGSRLYLTDKFFSLGVGAVATGITPSDSTVQASSAFVGNSNVNGGKLILAPGVSTGSGTGSVEVKIGRNAASGTTANDLATALNLTASAMTLGNVTILSGGTAPGASVVRGYNAAGTNVAGGDMNVSSGTGTGSATASTINLSTPTAIASGSTAQTLTTRASVTVEGIGTAFHLLATGTAPAVSSCGTSPTITGSDVAGKVTTGGGGAVTACTLTFAVAYTAAPACVANNETTAQVMQAVSTTTTLTLNGADFQSDVISYLCIEGS